MSLSSVQPRQLAGKKNWTRLIIPYLFCSVKIKCIIIAVDERIPNDFFTITEGAMFIFQKIIRYIHSNLIGIHFSPSINRASLPTALHFLAWFSSLGPQKFQSYSNSHFIHFHFKLHNQLKATEKPETQ